jgi:cob(I)alamin adenosyltransferase
MTENNEEQLKFLKDSVEQIKNQQQLLAEIERKLFELKDLAYIKLETSLTVEEQSALEHKVECVKNEILQLEQKLNSIFN